MKFSLKADVVFEARDVMSALKVLGKYFQDLGDNKDTAESIFEEGEIEMKPIK